MTEIRKDPFSGSVVIYSPDRENRPDFTGIKRSIELSPENCPFCEGNEDMTPPEIFRIGNGDQGWKVRVFPNKFPVFNVEEQHSSITEGIYEVFRDAGAHEVIVETPSHSEDISLCEPDYYKNIFTAYRNRISDLKNDFRLKYIQIFKNHKAPAGATISHHHSQLIALPFIPVDIKEIMSVMRSYYEKNKRPLLSDMVSKELESKERVIFENRGYIVVAPWYSKAPFQVSIYKKDGSPWFGDIGGDDLDDLSDAYCIVMKKLIAALGDIPFNFMLYNAPQSDVADPSFSWYIEIIPVLGGLGGFESATGTYINTVLPEKAAEILNKF